MPTLQTPRYLLFLIKISPCHRNMESGEYLLDATQQCCSIAALLGRWHYLSESYDELGKSQLSISVQ